MKPVFFPKCFYVKSLGFWIELTNFLKRTTLLAFLLILSFIANLPAKIASIDPDLITPSVVTGAPGPGIRVKMVLPLYKETDLYHTLYLPTDWKEYEKYPVIVEYAGNMWQDKKGIVDECNLGYGISGGKGVIWVCLPFVDKAKGQNASTWWGDTEATVDYCKQTVKQVCTVFGGDSSNLFIAGFSRGAIACNYIGLYDTEIASLWKGFICHSHYDGVQNWKFKNSDRVSALIRLKRLGLRPQFISRERSIMETKKYLTEALPHGNFQFLDLPFSEHSDRWVLRDIPARKVIRDWFTQVQSSEKAPYNSDSKR